MGRGRAKAKQTKVARELKYSSPNMDLRSLQQELTGNEIVPTPEADHPEWSDLYESGDEWRRA